MSGVQQLTIGGGFNGHTGLLSVPSAFLGAPLTAGSGVNAQLQLYLDNLTGLITTGAVGFVNNDVVAGLGPYSIAGSVPGAGTYYAYTDTDSTGAVTTSITPTSVNATVPAGVTSLVVEAPAMLTLTGAASTNFALFGATSNVDYTVVDGGATSIFAGGGDDTITLRTSSSSTSLNAAIYSTGNDTINLLGVGDGVATAFTGANDTYDIGSANTTITAEGNATVGIGFDGPAEAGSVYFINNSTAAATIFSSVFADGHAAANNVTAFGGVGGGFYIGGQSGGTLPNLLVGGSAGSVVVNNGVVSQVSTSGASGAVTLVGGAGGDVLEAQSSQLNYLFAGAGSETLVATSSTGSNLFQLGLNYPGIGQPQSNGVVSTDGSGTQTFYLGNSEGAQLFGSTVTGSHNFYNIVSDTTVASNGMSVSAGGGTFGIHNFVPNNDFIFLSDLADTAGGLASIAAIFQDPSSSIPSSALFATDISLSDGTTIKLFGVNVADVATGTGGGNTNNQTFIFTK